MNEEELENQDSLNTGEEDTTSQDNGADDFAYEEPQEGESIEEKVAKLEEQNRRLYARLQKQKEKKVEAPKEEPKTTEPQPAQPQADLNDDLIRARLEARGFLDEAEQDVIIKASKALGLSPFQAANDDIVMAKIDAMRQEHKTNNAIPTPSGKAGTQKHDVDYYIEKGELPDDPEMFDKVQAELVRRSKGNLKITNPND